ncbi:hypothetical protein B0H13DRAFT_2547809 [Mycena leptocephala]|nr:hypothetical protein B0H13DRAFT_2547809 [Mycena leptocephala]
MGKREQALYPQDKDPELRKHEPRKNASNLGCRWVGCGEGEGTSYEDAYNAAADAASTAPLFRTRQCRLVHAQPQVHRKFIAKRQQAALRSVASGKSNPKLTKRATLSKEIKTKGYAQGIKEKQVQVFSSAGGGMRDNEWYHGWSPASRPLETRMRRDPEEMRSRTRWRTKTGIGQGILRDEAARGSAALNDLQDRSG